MVTVPNVISDTGLSNVAAPPVDCGTQMYATSAECVCVCVCACEERDGKVWRRSLHVYSSRSRRAGEGARPAWGEGADADTRVHYGKMFVDVDDDDDDTLSGQLVPPLPLPLGGRLPGKACSINKLMAVHAKRVSQRPDGRTDGQTAGRSGNAAAQTSAPSLSPGDILNNGDGRFYGLH